MDVSYPETGVKGQPQPAINFVRPLTSVSSIGEFPGTTQEINERLRNGMAHWRHLAADAGDA